jgi:hypothetical protein
MSRTGERPPRSDPVVSLIEEIARAAQEGWSRTARLVILLAVAAAAVALIIAISK